MVSLAKPRTAAPPFTTTETHLGSPVTALFWGAETAMLALGDGTVRFWAPGEADAKPITVHKGAILSAVADGFGAGLVTGGDDGRVVHTLASGGSVVMADSGGRWIDQVALAPWGGLAWAHGATVELANAKEKQSRQLALPSSCGGLSFAPKGRRLAIAHYGGATIASFAHINSEPERLAWKGSHIAISWSPDARFLITAMQEQSVHIWRLGDKADLHMRGYPSKPRCFSWSADGKLLATSGGPAALVWPFKGKAGPQGQIAEEVGHHMALVTSVAWHPVSLILAIGYRSGLVALAEPGSDRMLFLREPDGAPVEHLAWRQDGAVLAFGCDSGAAGLIDCSRMKKE